MNKFVEKYANQALEKPDPLSYAQEKINQANVAIAIAKRNRIGKDIIALTLAVATWQQVHKHLLTIGVW